MSKLLINESPLQVLPGLAVAIGLNEAIVVQQIHYWLERSNVEKKGHTWVYNTVQQWHEQFPFWSADTVRRTLASLKQRGLLIGECLAENSFDKTMYYRIDYVQLAAIEDCKLPSSDDGKLQSSEAATSSHHLYRTETTTETKQKPTTRKRGASAPLSLPDWIDATSWNAFTAMRKKIKKPMTDHAIGLMIQKLATLRDAGHDVKSLLDNSTLNCWQDVYEPKAKDSARGGIGAGGKPVQYRKPVTAADFKGIDYRRGINADGTF
jgi:hypothetical protein